MTVDITNNQNALAEVASRETSDNTAAADKLSDSLTDTRTWKPLQLFNIYRFCLSLTLAILSLSDIRPKPLGELDAGLFQHASLAYLLGSVAIAILIRQRRPAFHIQTLAHVLVDILAITILMHASGGVKSGLGVLMIAVVAGGSLLMRIRTAIFLSAIATLAVLFEQSYAELKGFDEIASYTQAGLLGATYFTTAILASVLARRLRESEALAERRGIDLANMAQLTEYIIQRMQTGIVVVDHSGMIRLINESARLLLGITPHARVTTLGQASPVLAAHAHQWRKDSKYRAPIIRSRETAPEIKPRFARLGSDNASGILIFLEDTAAMAQQAQQLKLVSLGRLTASIAHEIRNPLGAISHAGQLLAESPKLASEDTRLTEIIQEHSGRVNTIIENILQLSRREQPQPEELILKPWLEHFVEELCNSTETDADNVTMTVNPENLVVRIDASQLRQILTNLCQNGLRHGRAEGCPRLEISAGIIPDGHNPYLDVCDSGPGIDQQTAQHLFEPFFTTETSGTGLGLYISRELCEANQARLDYIPQHQHGACFRVTFADPRRHQVT